MFKCQKCGQISLPGEKSKMVVVKTTMVKHPIRKKTVWDKTLGREVQIIIDKGGTGTQIVEEIRVHEDSQSCN